MGLIRRSGTRRLLTLLLATLLAFTLAAPALAEEVTDLSQARDAIVDQIGEAPTVGEAPIAGELPASTIGVALSGPTITFSRAIVVQIDIQVDASLPGSGPVSQTATDDANVDQNTQASSGTASQNGGIAISGGATAGTLAIIQQVNIQAVGGWVPTGGVSQTATNTADVGQNSDAASGGTSAASGGYATSGRAAALATAFVQQRNLQTFVGLDRDATGAVDQATANKADILQDSTAETGKALAEAKAQASTGKAAVESSDRLSQINGNTTAQW